MSTQANDADAIVEQVAEVTDRPPEEINTLVEEQLSEWHNEGVIQTEETPEEKRRLAALTVKTDLTVDRGRGGNTEDIPAMGLGFRNDDTALVDGDSGLRALAVVNPSDAPAGLAVFLLDSADGVDINHAKDAFTPLQTVRASGDLRQVGTLDSEPTVKKAGAPTYTVESTNESTFEIVDPSNAPDDSPMSDLPTEKEAKRQMVHQNFVTDEDRATVAGYASHEARQNADGWAAGFGVDIKRLRGQVVDAVKFDNGGGLMTVTDHTVFDEDDVPQDLIVDDRRTPGLVVDLANEHVVGEGSVVDVYGFIIQRNDGKYQMQGYGVVPVVEEPYDGDPLATSSGGDAGDESISEETIGGGA